MASAQASSSSDDSDCEYDEVAGVGLREARPYMYEPEVDSVVTGTTKSTVRFTAGRANQALNNWYSTSSMLVLTVFAVCTLSGAVVTAVIMALSINASTELN